MVVYDKISIKQDTKKKFKKCYDEFLLHHPEFKKMFLTEDFMIDQICDYYLKT